jgi:PAS domain S-box-containing protein
MSRATAEHNQTFSFAVMNCIPDGVVLRAPDGTLLDANDAFCRMTGYGREELAGLRPPFPYWPEDQLEAIWRAYEELTAGRGEEHELVFRRKSGERFPVVVNGARWADEHGQLNGWVMTLRDVTEKQRARIQQEMLRESEEQYRLLVDGVRDVATLMLDEEGRVVSWSEAAERMKGYKAVEIVGKHVSAFYPPEDVAAGRPEEHLRAAKNEGRVEVEAWRVRKDGSRFWAHVNMSALRDDNGKLRGFGKVTQDFTERRRVEESVRQRAAELAQLTDELKRKNAELDQFAYITSHDLKAPLRGIANLSQWIEEDMGEQFTDEARQQMELLRGRVHRMEALIDGILQISRVGRVRANPERVDVSKLLRDVVDLMAAPEGFVIDIAQDVPAVVAEKLRLEQVFMNVIGNAIKHGGERTGGEAGHVWITAEDRGEMVEFVVRDNGPGIAPEYHEKIFVIFQTLAARDRVEGTGLGLSLVKKIVEDQGGKVWVESAPGAGATFRFTWPKVSRARERHVAEKRKGVG